MYISNNHLRTAPFWYWNIRISPITNQNINSVIRWFNASFRANCAPQIYTPMLHRRQYDPYLLIADVMAIHDATQVWIIGVEPNAMFSRAQKPITYQRLFNHKVICAFNNGQSVVSHVIMKHSRIHYGVIIICDIPEALRERILSTSQHTNIGVSLFDYNPSALSQLDYIHIGNDTDANGTVSVEWINVSLPVCSSYRINNGNDIWYSPDSHHHVQLSSTVEDSFRYKLGLCTLLNMNDVYYDENTKYIDFVIEFIEYYRLHGVEQIYLFDLQHENTSIVFDYIFQYYIRELQLVTYIDWHVPYTHPPVHKYAALNSCFRRFGAENKYMINVDLDEFMFPSSMRGNDARIRSLSDAVDALNRNRDSGGEWTYIRLGCQWSGLCNEQQAAIDSFAARMNRTFPNRLAMHLCRTTRWNTLSRYKYIINPRKIHYAFLHYIILYEENETIHQLELRGDDAEISCIHAHKFPFKIHDEPREIIPYLEHMDKSGVLAENIFKSRSKIREYVQSVNESFVVNKAWFSQTYGPESTLWKKDGCSRSNIKWKSHNVCVHGSQCNQVCRDYLDAHFVHTCYNNTAM